MEHIFDRIHGKRKRECKYLIPHYVDGSRNTILLRYMYTGGLKLET